MELILMLLLPFPIGYFVKNRLAAFVTYIAVHGFAFTLQTLFLLIEWAGGSERAFGARFPDSDTGEVWAYGIVNLVVFAVGLALVRGGSALAGRRSADRRQVQMDAAV